MAMHLNNMSSHPIIPGFVTMLILVLVCATTIVDASCTVKNTSGNKVLIVPTIDVSITIEVDVGASIELPKQYQHCYFKNAQTGHQQGPFTLTDESVVACVKGKAQGTIDIYGSSRSLVSVVLNLFPCLPLVSICLSL